jgi:hypothetical protein
MLYNIYDFDYNENKYGIHHRFYKKKEDLVPKKFMQDLHFFIL